MMKNSRPTDATSAAGSVKPVASSFLPTRHGEFRVHVYKPLAESVEHVALVHGEPQGAERLLVRVHSECLTGDVFGSQRCDCGEQLELAMAAIAQEGRGMVIYLRGHEGRGIGLANKILAYKLQDQGRDTVEANLDLGLPVDTRDYQAATDILNQLGVKSIRLMTNNPLKMETLAKHGVEIVERVPVRSTLTPHNTPYLRAKQKKLGHMLDVD